MADGKDDLGSLSQRLSDLLKVCDDYLESYYESPVADVNIEKGFLKKALGEEPPEQPQQFTTFLQELNMHYITKSPSCKHPLFNAFYPYATPTIAVLAKAVESYMCSYSGSWNTNPALHEMEMLMCDWYAKALGLPPKFCYTSQTGGGILLNSATEGLLMVAAAAKSAKMPTSLTEEDQRPRFVIYASDQAHSNIEKVAVILDVIVRLIESQEDGSLDTELLSQTIQADKQKHFIPFMCVATVGTTAICAFDNITDITNICSEDDIWVHVDASYAGNFSICPEYRYLLDGVDKAQSVVISPQKGYIAATLISCLWTCDRFIFDRMMEAETATSFEEFFHLGSAESSRAMRFPNYYNMGLPTAKTANCLQLLFSFKLEGTENIAEKLRSIIERGKQFQELIEKDDRIELLKEATLGVVCFRLKDEEEASVSLDDKIQKEARIMMIGKSYKNKYYLRYVPTITTEERHVIKAWDIIKTLI